MPASGSGLSRPELAVSYTSRRTAVTVTVETKEVRLRPQVSVWEREVPKGEGVTGLLRPAPAGGGGFFGSQSGAIKEGKIEGGQISFEAGNMS
jgi:hypothetical protein